MLDEENRQLWALRPLESANEESPLCSTSVFLHKDIHPQNQRTLANVLAWKMTGFVNTPHPYTQAGHAPISLWRIYQTHMHTHPSMYIVMNHLIRWGISIFEEFPKKPEKLLQTSDSSCAVLHAAWLRTEQTCPITPIHARPGWPLRRAGPSALTWGVEAHCGTHWPRSSHKRTGSQKLGTRGKQENSSPNPC